MHKAALQELTAISPLDGRYWARVAPLADFFSEYALHKYRVRVEVEYFISLLELGVLPAIEEDTEQAKAKLREIYTSFTEADAQKIKDIEKTTNHDVKAVEYFIKAKFTEFGWEKQKEWIHFALTSQDINNTAIPLSIKDGVEQVYLPALKDKVIAPLRKMAQEWMEVPLLARTHGQSATPTRVGRELMVFVERLENQLVHLENYSYFAKFSGATGGLNAHVAAFPKIDWLAFADKFVAGLGMKRLQAQIPLFYTTQIDHYDNLGHLFDTMRRINVILIDLSRDVWIYISMDYFKQRIIAGEVGSSTMPHKVNPIDFENAEGNFGVANALFDHFSNKLPVSRLQRDLTDSTVLRNVGVPVAHSLVSFLSLARGLGKLLLNKPKIEEDLTNNWMVVAEAIQTVLRREGVKEPYELLKKLTRTNEKVDQTRMEEFIDSLEGVSDDVKRELKAITPANYIGVVPKH
ncbi:adenylosuccinate lyase, putative [Acanthamoeba castellanii str. Neff]|uniref:Adenylosuccinate lyase n=1 Tax=Acanthamoeba castellanii (strain ATCC 30010 / Neff) TaxID=1257118 RepID=L8H526_ACACF|nr:adenylosuccinate lyase, putative [Acanthamoeba castellanii str. Neff]ELR19551.1 adenylosuccinate lyase, putative [Acanthamoeba castellanii str. Neff]